MSNSRKHCVFLSSTGRTGTKFFGQMMSHMIKDCYSVHEPDTTRVSMPADWISKMAKFGVPKMLWGQYRQQYSLGKLSTTRARGLVTEEKAREYILQNRMAYIDGIHKNIYVESNHLVYGLLDLIAEVFPNSKIVWVMRDPRTWVRSAINSTAYHLYGPFDWDAINLSVRAYNFPDDPSAEKWNRMTKFERYCWYYQSVNSRALEILKKVPDHRVFRYEDLFTGDKREEHVIDLLQYSSTFSDGFSRDFDFHSEILDVRIHAAASKRLLAPWQKWGSHYIETVDYYCGDLMKQFGYGKEDLWKERLLKIKNSGSRVVTDAAV